MSRMRSLDKFFQKRQWTALTYCGKYGDATAKFEKMPFLHSFHIVMKYIHRPPSRITLVPRTAPCSHLQQMSPNATCTRATHSTMLTCATHIPQRELHVRHAHHNAHMCNTHPPTRIARAAPCSHLQRTSTNVNYICATHGAPCSHVQRTSPNDVCHAQHHAHICNTGITRVPRTAQCSHVQHHVPPKT